VSAFDSHLHVFRSEDEGLLSQGGTKVAGFNGVLDELQQILDRGRIGRAVVASALPVAIWRQLGRPEGIEEHVLGQAIKQNTELAEICAGDPRIQLAVGADATLDGERQIAHLTDIVERFHVRAIKIHPGLNFVMPSDPGFTPVYEFARDAGLAVIAHGGGASENLYASDVDYCAPENFIPVLQRFPEIRFDVAHFAHPYEDTLIEMAASFPNLYTDLSFTLGADHFPGDALRDKIRAFGAERVMFGTDFPYFDPEASLDRLESCGLSETEQQRVASGNAEAFLS
jgi:predicted TIM-barrel fold metal-dependent hydrolase